MNSKLIKYLLALLLLIISFQTTFAVWRWEEIVVLQNKYSLEYRKTYKMLYRFDDEKFKNWVNDYVRDKSIPNDSLFNDWKVIYYRICDREECKEKWKLKEWLSYYSIADFSKDDLSKDDYSKLTFKLAPLTKFLINICIGIIITICIFIYILVWIIRWIKFIIKKIKNKKVSS